MVVACAGVVMAVGIGAALVAGVVAAHRQAQAAADLAALAGAGAGAVGGDVCAAAATIAAANKATLQRCELGLDQVLIVVTVAGPPLPHHRRELSGAARAGWSWEP